MSQCIFQMLFFYCFCNDTPKPSLRKNGAKPRRKLPKSRKSPPKSRRSCCCSKSATNLPGRMHGIHRTCRTIPTLLPVQSQCGSHRQQSEVSSAIVIINNPRPFQAVTQAPPETAFLQWSFSGVILPCAGIIRTLEGTSAGHMFQ